MALGKRVFEDINLAKTGYCIVIHSVATLTNYFELSYDNSISLPGSRVIIIIIFFEFS